MALIVRSVTLGQVADVYGLGLSRPDEVLEGHMSPLLHLWLAWGLLNALPHEARAGLGSISLTRALTDTLHLS